MMMRASAQIALGRSDRGHSGVSDDGGDAARGQHHRRHRVRLHHLRRPEAGDRTRQREVHWLVYVFAALFVVRYAWLP